MELTGETCFLSMEEARREIKKIFYQKFPSISSEVLQSYNFYCCL